MRLPPKGAKGCAAALLLGRRRWEIAGVDPASDPAWRAHLKDLESGRPFRDFRYAMKRPDGTPLQVSISGDPVAGPDGRPVGWRGTGRDVSAVPFWHGLGLWKLAIILEGVRRRQQDDPRNLTAAGAIPASAVDEIVVCGHSVLDREG